MLANRRLIKVEAPLDKDQRRGHLWQQGVEVLREGANGKIRSFPAGHLDRYKANFAFSPADFRFTAGKDGSLYAFCMTVPPAGSDVTIISLGTDARLLDKPIKRVSLLGTDAKLDWSQQADGLHVKCPAPLALKLVATFKVEF